MTRVENGVSFRLKVPQNEKVPTLLHSSEVPQLPVRSYRVDQPRLQIGVSQVGISHRIFFHFEHQ